MKRAGPITHSVAVFFLVFFVKVSAPSQANASVN